MKNSRIVGLFMVGVLANAPSPMAQEAESSDDESGDLLELVVVTAERGYRARNASSATGLNVPLDELPVNIQVITADVVSDFQLLSQRDALQFHAAVDDKRVRGFNTGEFFRQGFIHLSDVHGYTVERLEILRGPSAILNGPVTPGGAINIITKQPRSGESFGEVGSYWGFSDGRDNRGFHLDVNAGDLNWNGMNGAFRFIGGYQEDTGFGTRVDNQSNTILPMLELRPTDHTVVNLEYYHYEINTDRTDRPMGAELTIPGADGGRVPLAVAYGIDPRSTWFSDDTDIQEDLDDFLLSVSHEFNQNLLGTFKYNSHNRDFVFGPGNRPRVDIFYQVVPRDGADEGSTNPEDYQLRRLTENLSLLNDIDQVTGSLAYFPDWGGSGSDHQLIGGFHYYDQDAHLTIQRPRLSGETSGFFFEFFDPATIASDDLSFNRNGEDVFFVTVLDRLERVDQTNFYLNYHGSLLDDRLNILAGLTHSDIEIARTNLRADTVVEETIADNSEILLQLGGVFDINHMWGIYANYSESQLPDLNDPNFDRSPPVRLGEQVEIGTRLTLLDGALTANFAYFQLDEELEGETFREAEADGFEIDASWQVRDNWSMHFSYANADTEITNSSNPGEIGNPLVDEVSSKAALWTLYELQSNPAWSFGASFIYTGERIRPTAGAAQSVLIFDGRPLEFDAETRLDAFVKYTRENYDIMLNLRNLTEEANLSNTVPRVPLQGGYRADGSPYVFDGEAEAMLSFTYRF